MGDRSRACVGQRRCPGREDGFGLGPMGDASLITPMEKTWHGFLVRPSSHELPHVLLSVPGSHRPKGPASVSQQPPFLESRGLLHLPEGTEGIKSEDGDKTGRSNSQAG